MIAATPTSKHQALKRESRKRRLGEEIEDVSPLFYHALAAFRNPENIG